MAAEFNFFCDPIAARIVMEELTCQKYLVTWELSKQHFLSLDDINEYCSHDNIATIKNRARKKKRAKKI